jgi:signal transduction histidine kinase
VKTIRLSSLGLKVLTAYVVGALLSIALAVAAAVWIVEHDLLADLELRERVATLASKIRFDANGRPVDLGASDAELDWLYDALPHETAYRVLDAAGDVVLVSKAGKTFWPPADNGPRVERDRFVFERDGMSLHGATEPFEHLGRQWYLQFATSERLMKLIQHKFALPYMGIGIGIFSAVLIIAFGLSAYITLRYGLKPLRGISNAAAAISPRSLHARLQTEVVPAEISPLVDSFNRVLDRLERGYRAQQDFLATAAHELKTPLALIRAQVELSADTPGRAELLQDVEHMSRQVQQLLHLAEASEVQNYQIDTVDVRAVAEEAAQYLQRMAQATDVRVVLSDPSTTVQWPADRGALFTLLKNLLENAIQHSPAGARVMLELDAASLTVRDWGPGVSDAQLSEIFVRFWRGAHRRDRGAGLGLAICREIALAHGWTLTASPADPGLRVVLANLATRSTHSR